MSTQQNPSTAKQNIALVAGDRARRIGQIVVIFCMIGFSLGFVAWYAYEKADDQFLLYMAVGLMAILFAGIGSAYSNMGLGRTVGSVANNNPVDTESIKAVMTLLLAENGIVITPPAPEESPSTFFEDNRDDNLEEDAVVEVPPGKTPLTKHVTGAANADPTKLQFLADRISWKSEIKTVDGKPVVLVGSQSSRRSKKKRTIYVYHIVGTNIIVYNRSRYGIFFMRMAVREENIQNFFEVFVQPPLTDKEKEWLARYDYQLV